MPLSSPFSQDCYRRLKELQINQHATPVSPLLRVSKITAHRKGKKEYIFLISPEKLSGNIAGRNQAAHTPFLHYSFQRLA
jgi:hypothetical protein